MGGYDDDKEPEDTFWITILGTVFLLGILFLAIWAVGMTT